MNRTLLYIVRNHFEDGIVQNKSILGVFTTIQKAYIAGREKWLAVHESNPSFYMEIKVVQPDMSDYDGCSAYNLDFSREYTSEELAALEQKIQDWGMWKYFEAAQHQREYNKLFKVFCQFETATAEDEFLKSKQGFELIHLVALMIGYEPKDAIKYLREQKSMLAP